MKTRNVSFAVLAATILTGGSAFALTGAAQESPAAKPAPKVPPAETVQLSAGVWEILKLTRAKIADDVTVSFIQNGSRSYNLSASEIIYLRKEGVSDRVLVAMLNQPARPSPAPQPSPQIAPQLVAPPYVPSASAPQYVQSPQPAPVYETAPASTVYVFPETPRYYYPSYPYSYYSYPYYYGYSYPSWSVGVSFGNCGYYGGWWGGGSYCDNGYRGSYYYGKPYYGNGYCGDNYVNGSYYRGGYRGGNNTWPTGGNRVANHQIKSPNVVPGYSGNQGSRFQQASTMRVNSISPALRSGGGFSSGGRPGVSAPSAPSRSGMASGGRASAPRMSSSGGFRAGRSR